tara:strand:- start:4380 stop:5240 length:861 start_codon:yes stop_codon:yes gene_type:complete
MSNRKFFLMTTALVSSLGVSSAALAADPVMVTGIPVEPVVLPAVSGINGKIAFEGGMFDEEEFGVAAGSLSLPIGTRFGFQIDGMAGMRDEEFVGGGGGHLFWRNPDYGLLGVYGSYTQRDDFDGSVSRVGVEGEYYWSNWTAKALVGWEFLEADTDTIVLESDDNFFAFSDISYYAADNLQLSVGHRYTNERNALALGVEYQLDQQVLASGVALFAEGRIGEDDYQAAWGGVRFYLGDSKSLIRRHREDDPDFMGDEDLFALQGCVPDPRVLSDDGINTCTVSIK